MDFDIAQFFSDHFHVGVVGYVYCQLSRDSGSGNLAGPFKSRVASLGPEVGYLFTAFGAQWYANLRGYWEFWAQNRLEKMQVPSAMALLALLRRASLEISVSYDVMKRERVPSAVGVDRSARHECAAASL